MPELAQRTLTGEEADDGRKRPRTIRYCADCDADVLRGHRLQTDHEVHDTREDYEASRHEDGPGSLPDDEEEEDDGPDPDERMGSWYDVTLSYTVEYRFRIPAYNDHRAKDRAEELVLDASPADQWLVHSDRREIKDITGADVPDDFDPYGSTPLWEVFD